MLDIIAINNIQPTNESISFIKFHLLFCIKVALFIITSFDLSSLLSDKIYEEREYGRTEIAIQAQTIKESKEIYIA